MNDIPQSLLQQMDAKKISGEHLELLGKKAAALWSSGEATTLAKAIVETVKTAGLAPEQVKRVLEFANTEAYLTEFRKGAAAHRVIDFGPSGPAALNEVLQDLNDGGGGSRHDDGEGHHYRLEPQEKRASATDCDAVLGQAFAVRTPDYAESNPLGESVILREKLADQASHLRSQLDGLEVVVGDLSERIYQGVKQAALHGMHLGEIVKAWSTVAPNVSFVKSAFALFTPRFLREQVFSSPVNLFASIEKTGSAQCVNPDHPIVKDFEEYCEALQKSAELESQRRELQSGVKELTSFLVRGGVR